MKSYGIIRKMSPLVNRYCLLTLYYSLIYPYLSYCNIVWASTYPSSLQKILLIQKRFVRLATSSNRFEPSAPLFRELNLLSIFDVNVYQISIFMFKCMKQHSSLPNVFHDFFVLNSSVHSYPTRRAQNIHRPLSRTTLGQFNIRFRGPSIWNSSPSSVKTGPSLSLSVFKNRMKKSLQ